MAEKKTAKKTRKVKWHPNRISGQPLPKAKPAKAESDK